MIRRAARIDANQPEIVRVLREAGATVQPLHTVGKGCPDLVVGYNGQNYLLEIKDPTAVNKAGKFRPSHRDRDHADWHVNWRGQVQIVWSAVEALQAIGVLRR